MGLTKTEFYTEQQLSLAQIAKAFAHPARIAILQHLLSCRQCINSDLVQELGLAQATISQHLKELKQAGILQGTVEGASINYCINQQVWKQIQQQFNHFFGGISDFKADCC